MHFDQVLEQASREESEFPQGWMQGRAGYGGLVAALMYRRLAEAVGVGEEGKRIRSVMVSFVGPVVPGPMALRASVLREGRSVTQGECRLVQEDGTRAMMQAAFGQGRDSVIRVPVATESRLPGPEQGSPFPELPGLVPEFTQHFDFRWLEGAAPFSAHGDGRIGGRVRFRQTPREIGAAHILALLDAWPPATLPMFPEPAPSSSLTWNIDFLHHDFRGSEWWQYRAQTDQAGDGYGFTQARLWNDSGLPVVLSRQAIVMFA